MDDLVKKSVFNSVVARLLLNVGITAAMLALVFFLSGRMQSQEQKEEQASLDQAMRRCITSCYALEGFYPPSLSYMKEHYGLHYDEDLFFVDYRPVASNIRPSYFIIALQEGAEGKVIMYEE